MEFLTFLLGLLLGHWLTLGRDKRKEFNEVSEPVRVWVRRQISMPDNGLMQLPSDIELDHVVQRLCWLDRRRFLKSWKAMREAYSANTSSMRGILKFERTEVGLIEMRKLAKLTKLR